MRLVLPPARRRDTIERIISTGLAEYLATKKIDTIISEQAWLLSRTVRGLSRYRPFIGKY